MKAKGDDAHGGDKLEISLDTLVFLVLKARAFDAQAGVSDPDESSNMADDRAVPVLEGQSDDPTEDELRSVIDALSEDQQIELVALAWVGRGDFDANEWEDAKALARERRDARTSKYLMGQPLLGDYLEDGAAALGINLTSIEYDDLYREDPSAGSAKEGGD